MKIEINPFLKNGKSKGIDHYKLMNDNGVEVKITNFGATVTSILVPDKYGKIGDVVLGFDSLEEYESGHPSFGVICGRYANRIGNASFSIDGNVYKVPANNGKNCLHGGYKGFDKQIWSHSKSINEKNSVGVVLTYFSPDNEEGFPGNMNVSVTYLLNNENELSILYAATTDKKTVVNLTNHCYFNLNGCTQDIQKQILTINSDEITAINDQLIPTGEYKKIAGTAFDFKKLREIGQAISLNGQGFDNNFILNKKSADEFSFAAKAVDPESGRCMEVYTTEPGIQLYTANGLNGTIIGKKGVKYLQYFGFCLEAQHYPDSPNHPEFPSTLLKPGETYTQKTVYKFGIEK